jgi:UDP-glucose 4-epimerase
LREIGLEMKRTALVTGAAGAIGRTLVERLLANGYAVRALVREAPATSMPGGVEVVCGDITDCRSVRRAVAGVETVFHLAAKLHLNNPTPALKDEYYRVNVEGTSCLARAARAEGARRLLFFSTINVYGSSQPGQLIDEKTQLRPDSLYAETKVEGEKLVLAESSEAVVLRVAAVYGPRMKGNYPRLVEALRRRRLALIGDGSNRRTLVHTLDLCDAAIAAAEQEKAAGAIFNVTDGCVHTMREIVAAIAAALGRRPPVFHLPVRAARIVAGLMEDGLQVVGRSAPVNRATIDKLTEDIAVNGRKLQLELGFQPRFDLEAGWRQTVGNLR